MRKVRRHSGRTSAVRCREALQTSEYKQNVPSLLANERPYTMLKNDQGHSC
jgi:hypothetical protein